MELIEEGTSAVKEMLTHLAILEIEDGNQESASNVQAGASIISKAGNALKQTTNLVGKQFQKSDQVMHVQYNPKSLKYECKTSSKPSVKSEAGKKITTISHTSTIVVSFDLVFHCTKSNDTSVKEKMDFIMNMLYQAPNKRVKFSWTSMQIAGRLSAFSGKYDMFDRAGNPLSGSMSLTIQSEMTVNDVGKFIKEIEKAQDE